MRQAQTVVVLAACCLVAVMYLANDDMAGEPHARRGDGIYRPVLARGDGHMLYLMARSTALDLDWQFDNDLRGFGDPWHQPTAPTGRKVEPDRVRARERLRRRARARGPRCGRQAGRGRHDETTTARPCRRRGR
ncbi:MAG: hypothetical protein HOV81_23320 [Kofleriaceae bacterium]|nr:hypothetical protein [Kofleriaceae bacterium]